MQVSAPQGIPLPKEVQSALEAAKNNVTVLNAETSRLAKLAHNSEEEVRKSHEEVASSNVRLAEINSLIENKKAELQSITKEANEIKNLCEKQKASLLETIEKQEASQKEVSDLEMKLEEKKAEHARLSTDIINRHAEVSNKEANLSQSAQILREALSKIQL